MKNHTEVIHMKGPQDKYAWTVKIGEKGQFVIPKEARDLFDFHPGDTILVLGDRERGMAILPKKAMEEHISRIYDQMMGDEPNA